MSGSPFRFKILIAVAAAATLGAVTARAQVSGESNTRARIAKARASIVLVSGENETGAPIAPGLGFVVGGNLIATDRRVIEQAKTLHINAGGKQRAHEVISRDISQPAAIIIVDEAEGSPLPLGDSDEVAVSDQVYVVALDSGAELRVSEGIVTGLKTINGQRYFEINAPMSNSSRGGPVFDAKGEVVGIAGESSDARPQAIAIPVSYLAALLRNRYSGSGGGMGMGAGRGGGVGAPSVGAGQGSGAFGDNARTDEGQRPSSAATSVDTKPVLLRAPAPGYTEQARRNQTQGTVLLRVLIGADGLVKQVRIVRGLPDGLNERAIAAAYQATFKPAMKDGQPVSYWMTLQMEFNLK